MDSTSCLAELIRFSIDTRVTSRESIASPSGSRVSVIISSATRETPRLAVAMLLSSFEIVFSHCLMTSKSSLSLFLINLAPNMTLSFSLRLALPSRSTLWFWLFVTMQIWQMQTWHSMQQHRVTSLSWNSCEQNGCRFSTASRSSTSKSLTGFTLCPSSIPFNNWCALKQSRHVNLPQSKQ